MNFLKIFAPGRMPTHAEIAVRQLEDARVDLLEAQREQESIEARVKALENRVSRLSDYCQKNPVALIGVSQIANGGIIKAQAQVWRIGEKRT